MWVFFACVFYSMVAAWVLSKELQDEYGLGEFVEALKRYSPTFQLVLLFAMYVMGIVVGLSLNVAWMCAG